MLMIFKNWRPVVRHGHAGVPVPAKVFSKLDGFIRSWWNIRGGSSRNGCRRCRSQAPCEKILRGVENHFITVARIHRNGYSYVSSACSFNTVNEIEVNTIFERVGAEDGFRLRFQNNCVRLDDSAYVSDEVYQAPLDLTVFASIFYVQRGGLDATRADTVNFVHVLDVWNSSDICLRVGVPVGVNLIGSLCRQDGRIRSCT